MKLSTTTGIPSAHGVEQYGHDQSNFGPTEILCTKQVKSMRYQLARKMCLAPQCEYNPFRRRGMPLREWIRRTAGRFEL